MAKKVKKTKKKQRFPLTMKIDGIIFYKVHNEAHRDRLITNDLYSFRTMTKHIPFEGFYTHLYYYISAEDQQALDELNEMVHHFLKHQLSLRGLWDERQKVQIR